MSNSRKRPTEEVKTAAEKKKHKVTQPQRLHYGLYNQGSTCYLNSVLQVLFMTTEMHDRLVPKSRITDEQLRNVFKKLKKTTCGTENITESLDINNVYEQRDAAEILELILHKVSPQASEVFQGQLRCTTKCSKGHSINEETNPFWTLPLSLSGTHDATYSVEKGFKMIFQPKSFYGDNMVYCNECGKKTEAISGCEMKKSPHILTLLLKRFDFDYDTMSHVTSDRCVDVPRALQSQNKKYKLYGMVSHMGSLRGGHYTATILSNEDNIWYEFDDDRVKKVEEQPFAKNRTYNSSTAYLLAYRESRSHSRDDKENRHLEQHQESREHMRNEMKKEAHEVRGEDGDAEVSRFGDDTMEDFLLQQKQNTSCSSKWRPDTRTTPEKRRKGNKDKDDVNCSKPCRSSTDIKKNPLLIFLIVLVCALIVILPIILTTLNKPR